MGNVFTPPEVVELLRITPEKVRRFIEAGELRGFNVGSARCRRPRYRVTEEALKEFEELRSGARAKPAAKRKPRPTTAVTFY